MGARRTSRTTSNPSRTLALEARNIYGTSVNGIPITILISSTGAVGLEQPGFHEIELFDEADLAEAAGGAIAALHIDA
jgi:hypothetical protein